MPEYLTPGVYFEFVDAPPAVRGVRTDIAGFVGLAERGPLNQAMQIDSWRQFQATFGGFVPYAYLAYAVKGFFENSGRTCFIVRIAGKDAAAAHFVLRNNNPVGVDVIQLAAKNEGTWGNAITFDLHPRPAAGQFSLIVTRNGREREVFRSLSVVRNDPAFFMDVINHGDERNAASQWITASLAPGVNLSTDLMPDPAKSSLVNNHGQLNGGRDGIASLTKNDFLGNSDPLATEPKGLNVFTRVDAVAIVCIPDIHIQPAPIVQTVEPPPVPPDDPCRPASESEPPAALVGPPAPEQPPSFTRDEIAEVQRSMIEHCELMKDRVAILETPMLANRAMTISEAEGWRQEFDSQRGFAALYHPWVKALDPLKLDHNPLRAVPPCGHIAGLYARTDFAAGVHKAPANEELFWAEDLTAAINDEEQALINPDGVNCLRAFPGRGIRVFGGRTISDDPDWRYVNVRRLLLMIEEAIDEATQWAVFEPNDFVLRQTLALSVASFLEGLWRQGALVGTTAAEAFYVKCDDTTNPPQAVNNGQLIMEIGVAPARPAEFIVFRIGRTAEELELVER